MFLFLKPAFNIFKKAILVLTVFFIVITLFLHFIGKDKASLGSSQSDPIRKNRAEIYKVINDKELGKTKEGKLTIALYKMSMCTMIGEACTNNPDDADKNFKKSVFGFMSNLIIIPYANPPASGIAWVSDSLQNAGFIPTTMAAEGIGFAAIKPFSNLWKIFRDLSYMLLVIVLIAIGFMIMFRAKINPQTVISVENALPKIVITLILITFSFAIAGFLIDLTYLIIALIISVLSSNNTYYDAGKYTNDYLTASPLKIYTSLIPDIGMMSVGNALISLTGNTIQLALRTLVSVVSGLWLVPKATQLLWEGLEKIISSLKAISIVGTNGEVLGVVLDPFLRWSLIFPLGLFIGFFLIPQAIIGALVWFTILLLFFRIFFTLFNSYLKIFLYIIFSPVILLFEAIPGKNVFSWWFKSLLSELLAFPLVITLLLVGNIISTISATGVQMWQPPFLSHIDPNTYTVLFGMMMLLLIPDFIKLTRELLGVKDLPVAFGLGTFFGGAGAAVGGSFGIFSQFGSIALAMSQIPGTRAFISTLRKGEGFGAALDAMGNHGRPASNAAQGKGDKVVQGE